MQITRQFNCLTWNPHTRLNKKQVNARYGTLLRLLDTKSKLDLPNKLLIYNPILKPTWTYELELWGSTKSSNLSRIHTLHSRTLRKVTNAPFYISNLSVSEGHGKTKVRKIPFLPQKTFLVRTRQFSVTRGNKWVPHLSELGEKTFLMT